MSTILRLPASLSAFALAALCAQDATADFTLFVKTGQINLSKDTQTLADGVSRNFDSSSHTYALAAEGRWAVGRTREHHLAVGGEKIRYRFDFQPSLGSGVADAEWLGAVVKYYFIPKNSSVHPFVGAGLGIGSTDVGSATRGTMSDDHFANQVTAGVEIMPKNIGLHLEIKKISNKSGDSGSQDFNASGYGFFLGAVFKF